MDKIDPHCTMTLDVSSLLRAIRTINECCEQMNACDYPPQTIEEKMATLPLFMIARSLRNTQTNDKYVYTPPFTLPN